MKTVKFRGKSLNTSMWVCGNLQQKGRRKFVEYEISPDTLCQFTGLYDKADKEIYEHDYISIIYKYESIGVSGGVIPDQDCICEGEVVYMDGFACFGIHLHKAEYPINESLKECPYLTVPLLQFDLEGDSIEVLGNVFDNPEIVKHANENK